MTYILLKILLKNIHFLYRFKTLLSVKLKVLNKRVSSFSQKCINYIRKSINFVTRYIHIYTHHIVVCAAACGFDKEIKRFLTSQSCGTISTDTFTRISNSALFMLNLNITEPNEFAQRNLLVV